MVLTDARPATPPDLIPGLVYPAEWHREQEDIERAWLDEHIRTQHFVTAA